MKVVFKESHYHIETKKKYLQGEIVDVDDIFAQQLIELKVAEVYKEDENRKKVETEKDIKNIKNNHKTRLIYPGKVSPGNYWIINDDGEAFIKEKISQNLQRVEIQNNFNFKTTNDKLINFKKGDIVYLMEGQFIAMKSLGYI